LPATYHADYASKFLIAAAAQDLFDMFEQSLYQQQVTATGDGAELFKEYEIKSWDLGPRIYKIIGAAAALNLLALLVVAQTSLLTMKGCDSPLVGRVCTVLDTVYVSTMLFGTDREMIDAEYDRTKIEDSEITFVDVTGVTPPLSYPEGYFQVANPEQFQASVIDPLTGMPLNNGLADLDDNAISSFPQSTFPQNSGSDLLNTPQVLPQTNPNVVTGPLPSFGGGGSTYTPPRTPKSARVKIPKNALPDIDENDVAKVDPKPSPSPLPTVAPTPQATVDPNAPKPDKNGVYLNKRPLTDYAKIARAKIEGGAVNLEAPFSVTLSADIGLSKDKTTVVLKNVKPVSAKNDPQMVKLAQEAILAAGDSGWFGYFDRFQAKKVLISLVQTDTELQVVIQGDQPSEERARSMASGLNTLIAIGRGTTDGDEKYFLERATTSSEGKAFFLKILLPKQSALEMIKRKLEEPAKADSKPSSALKPDVGTTTAGR
jgi:hypothetical protein